MKCPECQFKNREGAKFCKECGNNLDLACSGCGAVYQMGSKFCDECGHHLRKESKIETVETTREGERKHVTVLFSDLSGYTAMSERLDPEEVKEITGKLFDQISKVVAKYDGFIEKYSGDAVMALFGANQSHEDDPVRAVKSAEEIHDLVKTVSPQNEDTVGQPLQMHTGINTGLVVTGELNLEKGVHGVAGDTINIAARLSSAANAGEILVDHETYSRTEGYFQFENLKPVQLKGKANAVQVHRYLAIKEHPQKIHRLHGLRADLIGRKAEMAQLSEAVENLSQGKGSVFSIIGAAGTGKSRLVEEFKAGLDLDKIQWREGQAFPYAQNIPYYPLIDLISKAIQIDEGDSPAAVKEKIESSLEVLIGREQDIAPYIGSLYALDYPEIEEVSPEFWKAELQKAILIVLTALAQRAPTVICLEDLHWADPSTLELVQFLLSEIRHPVLFLCVYRPTISPFSSHQISAMAIPHQELHLRDLSLSEAQNMVESLLKTDAIPKDLQGFIRNKVEGNPFYLEEAINSLIESKILVPENGDWRVDRPITESEISATIQGVIAARVDRLEQESKRILQEASVIGRSFYYEILKRISEIKDNIDRSLSGLERFDLIKTKSIQPYLEYIFKHALTQEVVYNGLLKKERREIHERIGRVIEHLFENRLAEFYETLAYHFKNGQSVFKAVNYLIKSGEKSLHRYAVEESYQYYNEAFELLANKFDQTKKVKELIVKLLIKWALVYYYLGDFKGLNELLGDHETIAESLDEKASSAMFYAWLGFALCEREKFKKSYEYLSLSLAIGEKIESKKVIGYASQWLSWTCTDMGLLDEAMVYAKKGHEISKHYETDQYTFFKSLCGIGFCKAYKGEGKKAIKIGNQAVEYGEKHSNYRSIVLGHWIIGLGYMAIGDFNSTIEHCRKALQISPDPFYAYLVKVLLGGALLQNNCLQEAEKHLKEVTIFSSKFGVEVILSPARLFLGVILIAKGNMNEGFQMLDEVKENWISAGRKGWLATAELLLGKIYCLIAEGKGSMDISIILKNVGILLKHAPFAAKKAETHYNRAIEAAKAVGAKSTLGQAYLDLGLLHRAKNRSDKARNCINNAIDLFEQCGAEVFLKQAKEALRH
jgi:class 3 adenylate cyclase/tetratricopeptide (TPR) repeat protein